MPWKETRPSDERLKFIAEVLSGDTTWRICAAALEYRGRLAISGKRNEVGGAAALVNLRPTSSQSYECYPAIHARAHFWANAGVAEQILPLDRIARASAAKVNGAAANPMSVKR